MSLITVPSDRAIVVTFRVNKCECTKPNRSGNIYWRWDFNEGEVFAWSEEEHKALEQHAKIGTKIKLMMVDKKIQIYPADAVVKSTVQVNKPDTQTTESSFEARKTAALVVAKLQVHYNYFYQICDEVTRYLVSGEHPEKKKQPETEEEAQDRHVIETVTETFNATIVEDPKPDENFPMDTPFSGHPATVEDQDKLIELLREKAEGDVRKAELYTSAKMKEFYKDGKEYKFPGKGPEAVKAAVRAMDSEFVDWILANAN